MSQIVIDGFFPPLWTALSFSLTHARAHTHSLLVKDGCSPPWSYDSSSTSTSFLAPASLPCTELFCCLQLSLPRRQLRAPSCCFLHVPHPGRCGGGSCPGGVQGPGGLHGWLPPWLWAVIRMSVSVLRLSNWDSLLPQPRSACPAAQCQHSHLSRRRHWCLDRVS